MLRVIELAASRHRGKPWRSLGFTSLDERASHPSGIHHGEPFSVFAKFSRSADAQAAFAAELAGLKLLTSRAGVATPVPVGPGLAEAADGWLLMSEALPERTGGERTPEDLRSVGRTLATVHLTLGDQFGLAGCDGFFGPIPQDNRPVPDGTWATFYTERRMTPMLRLASDSGHLPPGLAAGIAALAGRIPALCGPEPEPALLHGDAQQNNFLATPGGAVIIDACPYYGHPELDLALLGYFEPVTEDVLDGYREIAAIDRGFAERRELWRLYAYLAVVAADEGVWAAKFRTLLASAVRRYR